MVEVKTLFLGTPWFLAIHVAGIVCLCISTISALTVIISVLKHAKMQLWKRPIGERLVWYLAVCDLCYSVFHIVDHCLMINLEHQLPGQLCTALGFFIISFRFAQILMVTYTAVNAFFMVVKGIKLNLGKYDYRLPLVCFGAPFILVAVLVGIGLVGPSGAWCAVNLSTDAGVGIYTFICFFQLVTMFLHGGCYLLIAIKLKSQSAKTGKTNKYGSSARVMSVFVIAYMAQAWTMAPYVVYNLVHGEDHPVTVLCVAIFTNLSGFYNFLAYAYVKSRERKTDTIGDENHSPNTATTSVK